MQHRVSFVRLIIFQFRKNLNRVIHNPIKNQNKNKTICRQSVLSDLQYDRFYQSLEKCSNYFPLPTLKHLNPIKL